VGQYIINAYEDGTLNAKVLKLPRTRDGNGNVTGYYYLETRRPTSTWNAFAVSRPDYAQGVLVHAAGSSSICTSSCGPDFSGAGGGGDSHLIDTQPASIASDWNDAPVLSGESYTDTAAGVSFR
jgi:hypothetical protein